MVAFFYSPKLIQETILCFKEENGLDISEELANEYLEAFAGLFLTLARHAGPDATERGDGRAAVVEPFLPSLKPSPHFPSPEGGPLQ